MAKSKEDMITEIMKRIDRGDLGQIGTYELNDILDILRRNSLWDQVH